MTPQDITRREVVALPAGERVFTHQTLIVGTPEWSSSTTPPLWVATCTTQYPATRCSCAMYGISWEPPYRPTPDPPKTPHRPTSTAQGPP